MKVFILGHKGMLGHMVVKYFKSQGIDIATTSKRFPDWNPKIFTQADYIVNCIGAIPQRTDNFSINYELPEWLSKLDKKIIHPGTDCEIDNDGYGSSKRKASEYIINNTVNTKILKTSIIGPELNSKLSLFEWFLSQKGEIFGYTKAMWNGNTTLQWAKQCLYLIKNWDNHKILSILEGETISKYDMLCLFKDNFYGQANIIPKEVGKNKCLKGDIKTPPLIEQLNELKSFYYDS